MKKSVSFIFSVILALLSLSSFASGEDWKPVTASRDGNQSVFIDTESIKYPKKHAEKVVIKAWGKIVYKVPEPLGTKKISYSLKQYEIYCDYARIRAMQMVHYYTDNTKETRIDEKTRQWIKIEPDTIEDALEKYLCKR